MTRIETLADGVVSDRWVTIYALCDPIDKWKTGDVRYVGKTVGTPWHRVRAHSYRAKKESPRLPVERWLKKHMQAGDPFHIRHLERVPPGTDWAVRERYWIAKFRAEGARLLNLTDGGDGIDGLVISQAHRDKIAAGLRKGAWFNCEICRAPFWRKPRSIKAGDCRFCSRRCYQTSLRGVSRPVPALCTSRGIAAAAAKRKARPDCKRGHPLGGDNLYRTSSGARGCKECRKLHKRKYRAKPR